MSDRRTFLSSFGIAAAALALPNPKLLQEMSHQAPPPLPDPSVYDRDEEAYWTAIRKQFLIPEDEVYLNNGTVGSSPLPVLHAIMKGYHDAESLAQRDPEDYPIWGYAAWNDFRDPLAKFVGCNRDEIALLRNATEANSYIANGIDLKPGDEVLMTDQEHPGGEHPWNLRAKRYGIVVKRVTLPKPVPDAQMVLNLFSEAISFTHSRHLLQPYLHRHRRCASSKTALRPRSLKGILSAVDGAHVPGMMKLDLQDIGCDMYSSSPHKWLQATKGTGFLYVRDEVIDRLWNTIATEGWDDKKIRAERFPAHRQFQCSRSLRPSRCDRIRQLHRHRPHRKAPPRQRQLHPRGNDQARRPFLDFSDPAFRCGITTVNVAPTPCPTPKTGSGRKRKSASAAAPRPKSASPLPTTSSAKTSTASSPPTTSTAKPNPPSPWV
jgi:kynureninase